MNSRNGRLCDWNCVNDCFFLYFKCAYNIYVYFELICQFFISYHESLWVLEWTNNKNKSFLFFIWFNLLWFLKIKWENFLTLLFVCIKKAQTCFEKRTSGFFLKKLTLLTIGSVYKCKNIIQENISKIKLYLLASKNFFTFWKSNIHTFCFTSHNLIFKKIIENKPISITSY